jgi:hypothetical protein
MTQRFTIRSPNTVDAYNSAFLRGDGDQAVQTRQKRPHASPLHHQKDTQLISIGFADQYFGDRRTP